MPFMNAVKHYLETQHIPVSLLNTPDATQVSARLLLVQDCLGQAHVLVPSGRLFSPTALCELTGRNFQCVGSGPILEAAVTLNAAIPRQSSALALALYVDQSLIEAHQVVLCGDDEQDEDNDRFTLDHDALQAWRNGSPVGNFTLPLQYPALPGSDDERSIRSAVEQFTVLRMRQRLMETMDIPPLPQTARRIIELRMDPNAGIDQLASVVETDPILAAQVVSWAASPYYAAPGKIRSVQDAIMRVLGFDIVINMALGLALGKSLTIPRDTAWGTTAFWTQSVHTAALMQELVARIPRQHRPVPGLAYLSGLLHNFGHLLLAQIFSPHFSLILRHMEVNPGLERNVIEQTLIGTTQEQLSGWLFGLWHLPEEVITAVRWQHHAFYDGPMARYANLLYVTQQLLRTHGIGNGKPHVIDDDILQRLHLDRDDMEDALSSVVGRHQMLERIAASLGR